MKKRFLAALLALTMVLALLPSTAFAANASSVYVNGVELSVANPYCKNGDTIASSNPTGYNAFFDTSTTPTPTLRLNNCVANTRSNYSATIYAHGDLTIDLTGDNQVTGPNASAHSYGVHVEGTLTVEGTGSLEVTGDTATVGDSCGVFADGNLEVSGGTLTATGGQSTGGGGSYGVLTYGNLEVSSGTLTATGGKAMGSGNSYGVWAEAGNIAVSSGTLTATGGEATGYSGYSYGVFANNGNIIVSGGTLTATGGSVMPNGRSYGLRTQTTSARIKLKGGVTTAIGNTSAVGAQPIFYDSVQTDENWYKWKSNTSTTEQSGSYTNSATQQFDNSTAPKYLRIIPVSAPAITTQPQDMTVTVGSISGALTVVTDVSGSTYQWYLCSDVNKTNYSLISAETTNSCTINPNYPTGTYYYYCKVSKGNYSIDSRVATVTVNAPTPGGGYNPPSDVTVYNAPSIQSATIWLTGSGLSSNDLLITDRLTSGNDYNALLRLANRDDVFRVYNITLRSGISSTGSAMYLTFDLANSYAGQAFTLVHKKTDGTYEYFHATANYNGDVTFGPLYWLSPFML